MPPDREANVSASLGIGGSVAVSNLGHIVSTPPADDAQVLASPPDGPPVDLVDTPEAGATVIRGSLLRLGALVVGTLATIASSAVVIRHLGVVDTGRWVTVMSLVVIVGSISDLGLSAVGVREYTVRPAEAGRRFLRNLLGMRVAFVIIGLVVAVAFTVVADYTDTMVLGTMLAGAGMVLYVIQQSLTIPLQARLRLGWVAGVPAPVLRGSRAGGGRARGDRRRSAAVLRVVDSDHSSWSWQSR